MLGLAYQLMHNRNRIIKTIIVDTPLVERKEELYTLIVSTNPFQNFSAMNWFHAVTEWGKAV